MQTIWKYELNNMHIHMPKGGVVLCVQLQNEKTCIWVKVDDSQPLELRKFIIVGTGQIMTTTPRAYIGTWQDSGFVWHLFELININDIPASVGGGYNHAEEDKFD